MAFFVFDYRQTLLFNSITVCVIACILDFNNGLEYYQAANTLITSLVLWLFDNSIFHCHLLCLMPLYTHGRDGGGVTAISGEKPLFDCVLHILFLISLHFIVSILHFIQPAPPRECPCEGLPVPVVEEDILINIFHLFSKLWAKIRRPPRQDSGDFGFPARPVRHAHTPAPRRGREEGGLVPE